MSVAVSNPLSILASIPEPIQWVVFGEEFPLGDPQRMRRAAAEWEAVGVELATADTRIRELLAGLPALASGSTADAMAAAGSAFGADVEEQSEFCGSMTLRLRSGAAEIEKTQWEMAIFGLLLTIELIGAAAGLFTGAGVVVESALVAEARVTFLQMLRLLVSRLLEGGLVGTARRLAWTGLEFAAKQAGVDAAIQLIQVANGTRDWYGPNGIDATSIATMAASGAGAAVGGMLAGQTAEVMLGGATARLSGRVVVGSLQSIGGVMGGAVAAAPLTGGMRLTLPSLINGAASGLSAAHSIGRVQAPDSLSGPIPGRHEGQFGHATNRVGETPATGTDGHGPHSDTPVIPRPVSAAELVDVHGIPEINQRRFQEVANRFGCVIDVRPTNPESARWLDAGALPKRMDIKSKTINSLDPYLGASEEHTGLVGFFEPSKATRANVPDHLWDQVNERYKQRLAEWLELRETMESYAGKGKYVVQNKVVYGFDREGNLRPLAGDHDVFDIRYGSGDSLSLTAYHKIVETMIQQNMGVMHGAHMYWPIVEPNFHPGIYHRIISAHKPGGEPLIRFIPNAAPVLVDSSTPVSTSVKGSLPER
ncbi:hypothetical protein [Nocardia sp. NPDC050793]|uniref:WXG100-like domain-containing protein n=1 Tax=Nocardia sp. NPDC050793 TaxID=3155159 RepID=UPI0033D6E69A